MTGRLAAPALAVLTLASCACTAGTPGTPAGGRSHAASPSPAVSGPAAGPTAATSPSPAATPSAVAAAGTDLTFTGPMSGRVQTAISAGVCGRAPAGFAVELHFTLVDQAAVLSIGLLDYHGPGSYAIPPERVSVRWGPSPGGQLMPATTGGLSVFAGERSGRIDATLGDAGARVTGTWACT